MFKPRLQKPEKGNPYYNTVANGGYSTAILGSPRDPDCNVLANCVGYAAGRFNEIIGENGFSYFKFPPNAEDFFEVGKKQGLKVGNNPKIGAIIVWKKGKTWNNSDGAGHVAIVEQIQPDGSIITSESGYGSQSAFWTKHRYKGNGNWGAGTEYSFLGFVYQPETIPKNIINRGDKGADVEWMQKNLFDNGYLRKNEIDGDFGTITFGALLAFQFDNGLTVDGICGDQTKAKL